MTNRAVASASHSARQMRRCAAFTLVESMIALSIIALAGSVLLLSAHSTLRTAEDAVRRTIAEGLADQLLDELATKRYMESGAAPNGTSLGVESNETTSGRSLFDDTDDYHLYSVRPVEGLFGEELGTGDDAGGLRHPDFSIRSDFFDGFRQRVRVYYVNPDAPSQELPQGQTSYYRGVEVAIDYVDADGSERELAVRSRVYAYIPPPP